MATAEENQKKYNRMENVLHKISTDYVSLPEDEIKRNNVILQKILHTLLEKVKHNCVLFKMMYQSTYYGGSYYERLKVGKPEEYDLDLLLKIPKLCNSQVIESDYPGFVHLQLPDFEKLEKQPEGANYKELVDLMDKDKFLLMTKVQPWMESNLNKVLNGFKDKDGIAIIPVQLENKDKVKFQVKLVKSGPAVTLKITGNIDEEKVLLDVDLVVAFIFQEEKWPKGEYRQNCTTKGSFHLIPKAPKKATNPGMYWRISFPEQERELARGFGRLKPVIRLLKRFRDHQKHYKIASYYIKTIFLWEIVENNSNKYVWEGTLSECFMKGLNLYAQRLSEQNIPFFWNKHHNLLENIKPATLVGLANQIKAIINEVDQKNHDPFVLAQRLVSDKDLLRLKDEVLVGKKHLKEYHKQELLDCFNSSYVLSMNESISLEDTRKGVDALTISDRPLNASNSSILSLSRESTPASESDRSQAREATPMSESDQSQAREATPAGESDRSRTGEATPASVSDQSPASVDRVDGRDPQSVALAANNHAAEADDAGKRKKRAVKSERASAPGSCDRNDAGFSRESSDSGIASDCDSLRILQRLERKMDVLLDAVVDIGERLSVVERKVEDLGRQHIFNDTSNTINYIQ